MKQYIKLFENFLNEGGSWKTAVVSFTRDVRKGKITYTDIEKWFEKNDYYRDVVNDLDVMITFLDELKNKGYDYQPTPEEIKKSPEAETWLKNIEQS